MAAGNVESTFDFEYDFSFEDPIDLDAFYLIIIISLENEYKRDGI